MIFALRYCIMISVLDTGSRTIVGSHLQRMYLYKCIYMSRHACKHNNYMCIYEQIIVNHRKQSRFAYTYACAHSWHASSQALISTLKQAKRKDKQINTCRYPPRCILKQDKRFRHARAHARTCTHMHIH